MVEGGVVMLLAGGLMLLTACYKEEQVPFDNPSMEQQILNFKNG